jgi:stage II sporulation protein E
MKTAKAQFIKLGAAPTYILKNSKVTTISNMNIPLGLINETDYVPIVYDLDKSSIVVQVTDGVINDEYDYNSNYITKYLQNVDKNKTVKVIGEELYKLILKEKKNKIDDDFTVLVSKVSKN